MREKRYLLLLVIMALALVSVASAVLPTDVTATIRHPGPVSYWNVDVTSTVGGNDISTTIDYAGKCGDSKTYISQGAQVFKVYSSLGYIPPTLPYANWNKINYVINNKGDATPATVQAVVWYFDGGIIPWNPAAPLGPVEGTPTTGKMKELIDAANAHPGFVPMPGQYFAVIFWDPQTCEQPVFIELPVPDIPTPEFPTLALPVAMLVGVIGAVQYVKTRKD